MQFFLLLFKNFIHAKCVLTSPSKCVTFTIPSQFDVLFISCLSTKIPVLLLVCARGVEPSTDDRKLLRGWIVKKKNTGHQLIIAPQIDMELMLVSVSCAVTWSDFILCRFRTCSHRCSKFAGAVFSKHHFIIVIYCLLLLASFHPLFHNDP